MDIINVPCKGGSYVFSRIKLLASNIPFVPLFFYTGERQRFVSCPF